MVGMVTIDVVEGSQSLGGSITYAAAAASAIPRRRRSSICIVTAAAPETDLSSLEKFHTLHKVPTNTTLTFGKRMPATGSDATFCLFNLSDINTSSLQNIHIHSGATIES